MKLNRSRHFRLPMPACLFFLALARKKKNKIREVASMALAFAVGCGYMLWHWHWHWHWLFPGFGNLASGRLPFIFIFSFFFLFCSRKVSATTAVRSIITEKYILTASKYLNSREMQNQNLFIDFPSFGNVPYGPYKYVHRSF